eukprot:1194973-Prorocentrum_minimum.AAC.6
MRSALHLIRQQLRKGAGVQPAGGVGSLQHLSDNLLSGRCITQCSEHTYPFVSLLDTRQQVASRSELNSRPWTAFSPAWRRQNDESTSSAILWPMQSGSDQLIGGLSKLPNDIRFTRGLCTTSGKQNEEASEKVNEDSQPSAVASSESWVVKYCPPAALPYVKLVR